MALSDVQICNMALSNIATRSNIESLTEESPEAAICSLWYDYARKQALEAYDWNFARKRITLALDDEAADLVDWSFRYQYPADCLRLRRIVNPRGYIDDAIPFDIEITTDGERKSIVTNLETATAVYTFDQKQPDFFEPLFVKALSHLIGAYIGYTLTSKDAVFKEQFQLFGEAINLASQTNSNERVDPPARDPDWIRLREGPHLPHSRFR